PAGMLFAVMPGRKPCVQVTPPFVEVAQPMSEDPPPDTRPDWKVDTIVLPKTYVSGSTWVRCWAWASVNGSELTWVSATLAAAGVASAVIVAATAVRTAGTLRATERADLLRIGRAGRSMTGSLRGHIWPRGRRRAGLEAVGEGGHQLPPHAAAGRVSS